MTDTVVMEMDVTEICEVLSVSRQTLIQVVEEGIVEPPGESPQHWLFDTRMVTVAKKACRLHDDLGIEWAGVALALQLMDEAECLRQENHRLRRRLERFING